MTKMLGRLTAVIVIMALLFSIGGVYASWHYARGPVLSQMELIDILMDMWVGSEELPNEVEGEKHKVLIDAIIRGTDDNGVVVGLNNPDSFLNTQIEERSSIWWKDADTLGSMDYWQEDNINNYFDLDTHNLSFLLYFPDGVSDTYYLFTTSIDLGENSPNIPIGTNVYPIYRTVLKKDAIGEWYAVETKVGYAPSAYYDNAFTGTWLRYPSFSAEGWVEGELGTSFSDAIYTYNGQTQTALIESDTEVAYYKFTASSAGTVTITSSDTSALFTIYNSNQRTVTSNKTVDANGVTVTFRASRNTTYYIAVSGDGDGINFTVNLG